MAMRLQQNACLTGRRPNGSSNRRAVSSAIVPTYGLARLSLRQHAGMRITHVPHAAMPEAPPTFEVGEGSL
jgi:hypothetical protein